MDDVIEHTIPNEFLCARDVEYLSELCTDFLNEKGIASDAFGFAVQIVTPTGAEYEPTTYEL